LGKKIPWKESHRKKDDEGHAKGGDMEYFIEHKAHDEKLKKGIEDHPRVAKRGLFVPLDDFPICQIPHELPVVPKEFNVANKFSQFLHILLYQM